MHSFDAARRETVRYHDALYTSPDAGAAGAWLARPHRMVADVVTRFDRPVHAYDLGAGSGRHTLLLAERLPAGSRVTAIDLLPSALALLAENAAAAGLSDRIDTVAADLERYEFPRADAGLVVAFSALEHVRSPAALVRVLGRCRAATVPGGVHVLAMLVDRHEVTGSGTRPALVECPLTVDETHDILRRAYGGWDVLVDDDSPSRMPETRDSESYELVGTLVCLAVRAPA